MWMSGVNYNAGAYMTRAAAQNYSRSQLQRDLQDHRWRHDVLAARPLKWMFADEAEILNQANREIINVVTDKTIVKPGMRLKDMPTTVELADLWRSGYWFAPSVTDRSLSNYGMAVCSATAGKLEKHQSRGLILRFLPKAWFR
jgi:hypothetical protein